MSAAMPTFSQSHPVVLHSDAPSEGPRLMAEKILAFAGSLRRESFNGKLVRIAAEGARDSAALVEEIHLRDIPLPLYDADFEREHGLPQNAKLIKRLLVDHDAVLVGSPEYNTGMTAV